MGWRASCRIGVRLLLIGCLLAGCSEGKVRLYGVDSGLRTVEVYRVHQSDINVERDFHRLEVSDKPSVDYVPDDPSQPPERVDAPFFQVGNASNDPRERFILYLPRPDYSAEDVDSIARLLSAGQKEHGIEGLRLGEPGDYQRRFHSPDQTCAVVVDIYGSARLEGSLRGNLGSIDDTGDLVLRAYSAESPMIQGGPLPSLDQLAAYADEQGGRLGETFRLKQPTASPPASPSPKGR